MGDPNYAVAVPIATVLAAGLADGVAIFFRNPVNPPTPETRLSSTDIAEIGSVEELVTRYDNTPVELTLKLESINYKGRGRFEKLLYGSFGDKLEINFQVGDDVLRAESTRVIKGSLLRARNKRYPVQNGELREIYEALNAQFSDETLEEMTVTGTFEKGKLRMYNVSVGDDSYSLLSGPDSPFKSRVSILKSGVSRIRSLASRLTSD